MGLGFAIVIGAVSLVVLPFVWLHNISLNMHKTTELLKELIEQTKPTEEVVKEIDDLARQGESYYREDKFEKALECYDKAIKLNPDYDANIWYNKGVALETLGRIDESKECFKKAEQLGGKKNR
jgi:tetratricopeptide (TPR) repeat protein